MRPIRLAVLFDQVIHAGGAYQQSLNSALLTKKLPSELVEVTYFTTQLENIKILESLGIGAEYLPLSKVARAIMLLRQSVTHPALVRGARKLLGEAYFERPFIKKGIDLIYFLSPTRLSNNLEKVNYIITIWDQCHRDHPEFPEVRWDREFENREMVYSRIIPKAVAVLVDSQLARSNIMHRYGVLEERIHVMPFSPGIGMRIPEEVYKNNYIDISKKYHLENPYIFYPAQFWPHKNHVYLLEGVKRVEEHYGYRFDVIFAGKDKGNLAHVQTKAVELDVIGRVRFIGFVPNEEMPYLYRQSEAMVMPTYFGPTNIPPLEAFGLGVPVLYPDAAGLREQVGDAALLIDLSDPDTMARHLANLVSNKGLRHKIIEAGHKQLSKYSDREKLEVLIRIIKNFQIRRACWR